MPFEEILPTYHFLPNPNLNPERSLTIDAGMDGEIPYGFKGGLTIYYTSWTDKMESITTPGTPATSQIQNICESNSKGVEVNISKGFEGGWNTSFNYTLTMTEVTKSAKPETIGNDLPHSPQHRFNLILSYEGVKDLTARGNLRYESSQFTDSRNIIRDERGHQWEKDGYYVVDLSMVKKLKVWSASVDLTFAIDNLFDEKYKKGFFQVDTGRVIREEAAIRF
jgi:outer membrane receptor protein involved in Fe transport